MLLNTATLLAPDDSSVELGVRSTDANGDVVGYLDVDIRVDPAALAVFRQDLAQLVGALAVQGRRTARVVSIEGTVVGTDRVDVNQRARALGEILSDHADELVRIRYDATGETLELGGVVDGAPEFEPVYGKQALRFTASLICPSPVALEVTSKNVALSPSPGTACTNDGNATVWPVFTATVGSGTVTSIRIGNSSTGDKTTLTGLNMTAGQVLTLDGTPGRQVLNIDGVRVWDKRVAGSRWPSLPAGDSDLYVEVLAGGGTLSSRDATWRDGWDV